MVIDVGKWELELMIDDKVIVSTISVCQHGIHLICQYTITSFTTVSRALHPDRICPLQEPWTRVDIACQRDPQISNTKCICFISDIFHQNNPFFPKICGMIVSIDTTIHMTIGFTVANNPFTTWECIILSAVSKTIPLPVIDSIVSHPLYCHFLEILNICVICNVYGTTSLAALAGFSHDISKHTIVVISTTWSDPHTEVGTKILNKLAGWRQAIRELGIKLPEAFCIDITDTVSFIINCRCQRTGILTVDIPSIIHYIGFQRSYTCF